MAVKSKAKTTSKSSSKPAGKKSATAQKAVANVKSKEQKAVKSVSTTKKKVSEQSQKAVESVKPQASSRVASNVVRRTVVPPPERKRSTAARNNQFTFMKAPTPDHAFEVGDNVEVFCDHEKSRERIRGWIKGIVVQVDNKMVAVQFRSNVFLTDGWMVPDRILWYPLASEHIRPVGSNKKSSSKKDFIPDY